jgi:hypothetical protein
MNRVRDELRRLLGVIKRISYIPDIYGPRQIKQGNSWGFPHSRYIS